VEADASPGLGLSTAASVGSSSWPGHGSAAEEPEAESLGEAVAVLQRRGGYGYVQFLPRF
jgi:hypothetical protein